MTTTTTTTIDVSERTTSRHFGSRLFAIGTLAALITGLGFIGHEGYLAITDAFVAPAILSPDSDLVLQNKLRMSELAVERSRSKASLEAIDADISACTDGIAKLKDLKANTEKAIQWTKTITEGQTIAAFSELNALQKQKTVLSSALSDQEKILMTAQSNMDRGVISKMDFAREVQASNQLQVALLENDRVRTQAEMQQKQVWLARKSLSSGGGGGAIPMPEILMREDQIVRVELEMLKLESESRSKGSERRVVIEKLAKIDELETQLKSRPIFRATEKSLDLAFVPYSQADGVTTGSGVYDCVWGVLRCKAVGTVSEIVPGEVILPDPWGTPTRGQYAVLDLRDRGAAKSKSLRVRAGR